MIVGSNGFTTNCNVVLSSTCTVSQIEYIQTINDYNHYIAWNAWTTHTCYQYELDIHTYDLIELL